MKFYMFAIILFIVKFLWKFYAGFKDIYWCLLIIFISKTFIKIENMEKILFKKTLRECIKIVVICVIHPWELWKWKWKSSLFIKVERKTFCHCFEFVRLLFKFKDILYDIRCFLQLFSRYFFFFCKNSCVVCHWQISKKSSILKTFHRNEIKIYPFLFFGLILVQFWSISNHFLTLISM